MAVGILARAAAHRRVVGEFPETLRIGGVGDVERVVRAAALVQSADQDGLPRAGAGIVYVVTRRAPVHEVLVKVRVVRVGEFVKARKHGAGNVCPQFLAAGAVVCGCEGVQHAVIGSDVHHRSPARHRRCERGIPGVAITGRRAAYEQRLRVHDVAQHAAALAIQLVHVVGGERRGAFLAALAAEEVHHVRPARRGTLVDRAAGAVGHQAVLRQRGQFVRGAARGEEVLLGRVERGRRRPVGLPAESQANVFQVKSTRLLVAPARNSLMLRVSQAARVLALSLAPADHTGVGWTWLYVGLVGVSRSGCRGVRRSTAGSCRSAG